jgi:hypothetical protein
MAFVCHGTDSSSYCLLGWDLVSIPTIELLKLLSCYLYDDLLDLCFVLFCYLLWFVCCIFVVGFCICIFDSMFGVLCSSLLTCVCML